MSESDSFARAVLKARLATGLSQRRLAAKLDWPARCLERWEQGINRPKKHFQRYVLESIRRLI
jgi:ribosome-binding protein aMBF1 (putative translation factor)